MVVTGWHLKNLDRKDEEEVHNTAPAAEERSWLDAACPGTPLQGHDASSRHPSHLRQLLVSCGQNVLMDSLLQQERHRPSCRGPPSLSDLKLTQKGRGVWCEPGVWLPRPCLHAERRGDGSPSSPRRSPQVHCAVHDYRVFPGLQPREMGKAVILVIWMIEHQQSVCVTEAQLVVRPSRRLLFLISKPPSAL